MLKGNPAASGLLTLLDCPFDANTSKVFWWKLASFDLYVVWCSNKKIILSYIIIDALVDLYPIWLTSRFGFGTNLPLIYQTYMYSPSRASIPPEAIMHFFYGSDSPLFSKKFQTPWKILPFSIKISIFI